MATHSSIIAWEIPWTRSLAGYSPRGHRVGPDLVTEQLQQRNGKYLGKCKIFFLFNFKKQMDYLKQ